MIEIYTGKPGAGKSYGACVRALSELEFGERDIVTNVELHLSEINAYFQRKGRKFVDVFSRVRLITREQAAEFWRFRGRFSVLPRPGVEAVTVLSDLVGNQPGVLYLIDEAHVLFDARRWAKSAEALTFYNSQHRKLGDDCVFVTQFLKLIEIRVRGFAELFHVFRNFAGSTLWSVLAMPKRMRELVYSVEPGAPGLSPDYESWHALDREKAACYDTMAGVGVTGGRAAEVRKARGLALPWWSVLAGVGVLGVAFWFVPRYLASKVMAGVNGISDKYGTKVVGVPEKGAGEAEVKVVGSRAPKSVEVRIDEKKRSSEATGVWMTGRIERGGEITVSLSDGRFLHKSDLIYLSPSKAVTRDGFTYWRKPFGTPRLAGEGRERGAGRP